MGGGGDASIMDALQSLGIDPATAGYIGLLLFIGLCLIVAREGRRH